MTTIRLYVVDTSYFLDLYRVDGCWEKEAFTAIQHKFSEAIDKKYSFYVPSPVIFELANHIADVKNSLRRKTLANQLNNAVISCIDNGNPWVLTPLGKPETIHELMAALTESTTRFATEFSDQKLGLTDTVVILEAERLKKNHPSGTLNKYCVHIWSRHRELKSREPDNEPDPYV